MFKTIVLTIITFPAIIIFIYLLGILQSNKEKRLKIFSYCLFIFLIFSIPATSLILRHTFKKRRKKNLIINQKAQSLQW